MTKFKNKVLTFLSAIGNVYRKNEEREDFSEIELKEEALTDDFTAMLVALSVFYENITGDEMDLIGFTHILNRLAIQYIMGNDEEESEE